jgi:hypothetical protein
VSSTPSLGAPPFVPSPTSLWAGAGDMLSVVVRSTLLQLRVPGHLLGRIAAINQIFIGRRTRLALSNREWRRECSAPYRRSCSGEA